MNFTNDEGLNKLGAWCLYEAPRRDHKRPKIGMGLKTLPTLPTLQTLSAWSLYFVIGVNIVNVENSPITKAINEAQAEMDKEKQLVLYNSSDDESEYMEKNIGIY